MEVHGLLWLLDEIHRYALASAERLVAALRSFDEDPTVRLPRRELVAHTIGIGKLSDTLLGYQALVGLDYRVSDGFTVGVKARRVGFGQFEAGEEWDQLRSHESTIGRGISGSIRRNDRGDVILGDRSQHEVSVLIGNPFRMSSDEVSSRCCIRCRCKGSCFAYCC